MNAVIYARFSSDRQREESIEGQVRECNAYAEKHGIKIVETYIDRAKSASKNTEKREDFLRMIQDSAKGHFDMVLVWKLDRFARDRFDSAHYKHTLKKNGVKVVSATEAITEGPEGIILESLLEGMAEYYSAELSEKVKRGLKENALKGKRNGGPTPLGYQLADHKLVIDPITAPVVLEVYKRYADGETIREILEDLNQKGIKSSKGHNFTYSSFKSMLRNRTYIGEFRYSDTVIPGGVPAIVPEELFERVQARTDKNRHAPAMAKAKETFLLTTKLFCGKCGNMMVGESGRSKSGKVHYYYKCGKAKRERVCNKKAVRKTWIEDVVIQQTMLMVMDDALMERLIDKLLELQGVESYDLRLLKQQLAQVEAGIENMLNAIQAGIITASTKERLAALETQKADLASSIQKEEAEHPILTREQIAQYLYRFRRINTKDQNDRQRLVDCFLNSAFVFDDRIVLTFNYKKGTKTITLAELGCSDSGEMCSP